MHRYEALPLLDTNFMQLTNIIKDAAAASLSNLYPDANITSDQILINETKPEFEGEYTIVLFPFVKALRANPEALGQTLGEHLVANNDFITQFNVIKGFLNISISDQFFIDFVTANYNNTAYGKTPLGNNSVMVEYSSPNTNKPLHFGHLRNNFLGWSVSQILEANGSKVIKANLVNDRGIHICKSMIAWQKTAQGSTPESTGIKGDHLVGDYYVKFNDIYKIEVEALMSVGQTEEEAKKNAPIMEEAQEMLRKWEAGDPEIYDLWKTMNQWVYAGFDKTYSDLGIAFDKMYYESNTYLLGKSLVEEGLAKGVLYKKENGSVWIDLTPDGLDEKLLLRGDGTSVYMTQDLGTAKLKYEEFQMNQSIYVIADEQNYHMQVLKLILEKLGEPCADGIYHLSYGMVELPSGRMKSREGTVVDADDMIAEMIQLAKEQTEAAGKTEGFTQQELDELYQTIGLGALKFYLLKVEPRKKMIFNPAESIDLHGFTATFIQYAHARICSILKKNENWENNTNIDLNLTMLAPLERNILLLLEQYPQIIDQAAKDYNPASLCNYVFKLAQAFNSFFDKHSIIRAESESIKVIRLMLAQMTATTIKNTMRLLGINVPDRM